MVRAGFGLEEPDREKRLESVIRFWLKDALAVEQKSSRKKKGLAVELRERWEGRRTKEVYQSMRVIARWTTQTGTVDREFNGKYAAQVIGEARNAGEYRLLFGPIEEGDGETRPPQEHPCVPINHIKMDDDFVKRWWAEQAERSAASM